MSQKKKTSILWRIVTVIFLVIGITSVVLFVYFYYEWGPDFHHMEVAVFILQILGCVAIVSVICGVISGIKYTNLKKLKEE